MTKLFHHLKPMAVLLLTVLILVASQAVAELYLPEMMSDIINDGIYLDYEPMYVHETMPNPFGEFDITGDVEGFDKDTIPVFEMKDGFSTVDLKDIWNSLYPGEVDFSFKDIPVKDSRELFNEVLIPFMDSLRPYQIEKMNKQKREALGRPLDEWANYEDKDADTAAAKYKITTYTPNDTTDDYMYGYYDYPLDVQKKIRSAINRLIDFDTLLMGKKNITVDSFLDMFEEKADGEEEDENVWRENENARHMLVSCIKGMKHSIYDNILPIPVKTDANGNPVYDVNGNFIRIEVDAYGAPVDPDMVFYEYDSETERYKPFPDYELILCNEVLGYAYKYNGSKWIKNELGTAKSDANVLSMTGRELKNTDLIAKYIGYFVSPDRAEFLASASAKTVKKEAKRLKKEGAVISKALAQTLYDDGYTYEDIADNSFLVKIGNILKLSEVGRSKKKTVKAEDFLIPDGETIQMSNLNFILKKGGIMLSLTVFASLCAIIAMKFSAKIAAVFSSILRSNVFSKVESFSLVEFDKYSTASLITRSTNDINQIQNVFLLILRTALAAPVTIIGGLILSMNKNRDMTMVLLYTIPILFLAAGVAAKIVYPIIKLIQQKVDHLTLIMRESLTGIRVVRAFTQQEREEKRFALASRTTSRLATIVARYSAILAPLIAVGMNCTMIGIVWIAAKAVANDTVDDVGTMMAVMQYVTQIMFALIMLAVVFVQYPRAGASANRINQVMATTSAILDAENASDNGTGVGRVEFKNVSFKYTQEADKYILENISFLCEKGKTTAIIGGTGSGKSSIINLIPRFYDINDGEILINGQPIKTLPQEVLRQKIGFIPQRSVLFSGTIRENLKYGKPDATDAEIWEALEIAQSSAFVKAKEDGLDSRVEQGGKNFSGGQKQRLSIARAIVRRPEIYIFDDSFSALDFKTDAKLRAALKKITAESTVIIVAQRIGTIMDADNILVVDEGKIVGSGKHRDLINNCKLYRDIALSQLSKEELGL